MNVRNAPAALRPGVGGPSTARYDGIAAVIGAWSVVGLMLDGRAHETGAVESFFTPWHGVLYSGVAAALLALGVSAARSRDGSGGHLAVPAGYGLAAVGAGIMALAGAADMLWHMVFGIEEDLAALLSPTHLMLLVGGLLLLSAPARAAWLRGGSASGWRVLWPVIVSATLTATTVGFFVEFASPFHDAGVLAGEGDHGGAELGIAGVLITTLLLTGTLVALTQRFGRLPFGAATLVFAGVVALLSLAADFAVAGAIAAAVLGGLAADGILYHAPRGRPLPLVLALVPVPFWAMFYAVAAVSERLTWDVELWSGSIVLSALAAYGVASLAGGGASIAKLSTP